MSMMTSALCATSSSNGRGFDLMGICDMTSLLRVHVCVAHHLAPFRHLGLEERLELLGRVADDVEPEAGETLPQIGRLDDGDDLLVQRAHDLLRRARVDQQA